MGDLLVTGSCNGKLRALDKQSGKVKWEYDITKDGDQRQFHGDPLVAGELLLIGTDGSMGHVYAFEASCGKVRWRYRVNEHGVASDIVRVGDSVYAVTLSGELLSLDLQTGKAKWTFNRGHPVQDCLTCSSPAADGENVYFGDADGFAYAVNAQSGKVIWKRDLGARVSTSAAIHGRDLYLGTANRHLYRLNADSGELLGDAATAAIPSGHLLVAGDSLIAFVGDEVIAGFALDLKKTHWSAEASKTWTSARPYAWGNYLLAGDRHELVAFRLQDGLREWSYKLPETIRGIGTSPDVLYIGTLAGPVFAYAPMR